MSSGTPSSTHRGSTSDQRLPKWGPDDRAPRQAHTAMTLRIVGGQVITAGGTRPADITVEGPTITSVGEPATPAPGSVIDARGRLVAPGYIDLQTNGALGHDLTTDPAAVWAVAAALPRFGVTAFLPTVITAPLSTYTRALAALGGGPPPGWIGAVPLGWHIEGPMLNSSRRGAHPERHLRPPHPRIYGDWSRRLGVALVTIAPELPGALDAVARLKRADVVVAAGHTNANTREMQAGVAAGISYITHIFNAMAPLAHRDPGPVGLGMGDDGLVCGVISDGVHIDPVAINAVWRAVGPRRFNVVTDAVATLGMPPGAYALGSSEIRLADRACDGVRNRDGTLVGSNVGMDEAVRNLVGFTRCDPHDAIATVTSTPAAVLGARSKGHIEKGADADLVILTPGLEVVTTIVGGRVAYTRESRPAPADPLLL
jgi:N-acetylglucosamine-6-phosphate deacetylase